MNLKTLRPKLYTFTLQNMAAIGLTISFSDPVHAYVYMPQRCAFDTVEQSQAAGRNAWFKKCFKRDYIRIFGPGDEFVFGSVKSERRFYVTFGAFNDDGTYSFPGDWKAPRYESAGCKVPPGYEPIGVCTAGCFVPNTQISFNDITDSILSAKNSGQTQVTTLAVESTLDQLKFQASPISSFTSDIRDAQQEILTIRFYGPAMSAQYGTLEVTPTHPLVDMSGKIREAQDFKKGEFLVAADGRPAKIASITGKTYFGKVHNLWIDRTTDAENIVVAQGVLAGTMHHQVGMGASKINQEILRSKIPQSLLE